MKYCARCVLPDSRPNLSIGDDGVCNACRAHATRPTIDWDERGRLFGAVVREARSRSTGYDCVIPVSGGKDSTWQVVKCLEAGLNPLAVTWKTPARTPIGQANLDNLVRLGVDHIDYQISPKVEAAFMLRAFERFGSTAIPMHMALFAIPLSIAVRFRIPLVVWGENSAFEYGSKDDALTGFRLDAAWLARHGVTHGTTAADWVCEELPARSLAAYFGPDDRDLEAAGVSAVFLGYYFAWDPQESYRVACMHGFRASAEGARTGYYDYADIDDEFISIHHHLKWHKFGFTRLFDNLSLEIRNGRLSRSEAVAVIARAGDQEPAADIQRFCEFAGIDRARFDGIAETFRNPEVWHRADGRWKIPGFLIPDWEWR
ncbi:MAG: N-acetyl sugar amidotransferase [Burkholderiales bacterium]